MPRNLRTAAFAAASICSLVVTVSPSTVRASVEDAFLVKGKHGQVMAVSREKGTGIEAVYLGRFEVPNKWRSRVRDACYTFEPVLFAKEATYFDFVEKDKFDSLSVRACKLSREGHINSRREYVLVHFVDCKLQIQANGHIVASVGTAGDEDEIDSKHSTDTLTFIGPKRLTPREEVLGGILQRASEDGIWIVTDETQAEPYGYNLRAIVVRQEGRLLDFYLGNARCTAHLGREGKVVINGSAEQCFEDVLSYVGCDVSASR